MNTQILKPTRLNYQKAANQIKQGNLIGMPTETVYGLAANALDYLAIERIFVAKNRPQDNPLIVHVSPEYDLRQLVTSITPLAQKLIQAFTPGPITLVLESKQTVSNRVSCGLNSIAIRIPNHPIAQEFLRACNLPIAAPSANLSTRMSATTAQSVKEELNGKLKYILDGGVCEIGVESTVVDVRGEVPIILRPGKITSEMIQKVAENVQDKSIVKEGEKVLSPGQKYKHYAPSCPVYLFQEKNIDACIEHYKNNTKKSVILCLEHQAKYFSNQNHRIIGKTIEDYAKNLYQSLREAEKEFFAIYLLSVPASGFGTALMNRLQKIAGNNQF